MNKLLVLPLVIFLILSSRPSFSQDNSIALNSDQMLAQSDSAVYNANVELLRRELDAEKKINAQLRKKLEHLEVKLAASDSHQDVTELNLDKSALPPKIEPDETSNSSAIEQALIEKGVVLLPAKTFRLTPGFSWGHYGTGSTREDSYNYNMSLDVGLPLGFMGSVRLPFTHRDLAGSGSNNGLNDISLSLSKQFIDETSHTPGVVAQVGYRFDNGKDPFGKVPIGSGFNTITTSISSVKHFSPVAVYGNLSYSHSFDKYVESYQEDVSPGNSFGLGTGISLAATPDISLNAGFNISLIDKTKYQPLGDISYYAPRLTVGYITLGSGFNLSQHMYLDVSAAAGVTKDASDFVLSLALPYRF